MIIDDLSQSFPLARCGGSWQLVTDTVMGGVSLGTLKREMVAARPAIRLQGGVRLENNGGFVQMSLDLHPDAIAVDVSGYSGIEIEVHGNDEDYDLRLRTAELERSWQSYRQSFHASAEWQMVRLPFANFEKHRTEKPLNLGQLKRIGFLGIGRKFDADLAVLSARFY